MNARNGDGPDRGERPEYRGNLTPAADAYLARRSEAFRRMTQVKGRPLTYGTGKPLPDVKPPTSAKRRK